MFGSGLASLISTWVMFFISSVSMYKHSGSYFSSSFINGFYWVKKILTVGFPIGLKSASEMSLMFLITMMTGMLGENAMAASQVSSEFLILAIIPFFAMGEACSITISHVATKARKKELAAISKLSILFTTSFTILIALIFSLFHYELLDVFIDFNGKDSLYIYHLSIEILEVRAVKMLIDGPVKIYTGLLAGIFDTFYPFWTSLLSKWLIAFPLSLLLGFYFDLGVVGFAFASVCSEAVIFFLLSLRWVEKLDNFNIMKEVEIEYEVR